MLTTLFIVGRTTLFTPVDINYLQQVVAIFSIFTRVGLDYFSFTTIVILPTLFNFPFEKNPEKTHDFR
jgi:hypothetical protein